MKRYLPKLIILSGALLVLVAFGVTYFQHPGSLPLPYALAEVRLHHKSERAEAVAEFTSLHQQWFPLTSGAVGYYGREGEATLWVAGAPFAWMAGQIISDMHIKIAAGNSPFRAIGEQAHKNHTIHKLEGLGQQHFYFQAGHLIVWLAVEPDLAEEALAQILEVYR
ncbi:MAG TPA: hypothetical protein VI451_12570 [Anaerolineales bacterium]|nr:hypothetical protein [Anaerolineales bacterium]